MSRVATALLVLCVVLIAVAQVGKAHEAAAGARVRAEEAERRALLASEQADGAWAAYTARTESLAAVADSLDAARLRAGQTTAVIRVRVDTLVATVPDTGAVPRPLHDSIVAGYDRLVLSVEREREAAVASASLWERRWAEADSGWAAEREANALLRLAVDEWRTAASPSWWSRLQRNAGLVAITATVAVAGWEAVR